jgi:hypothetical protein
MCFPSFLYRAAKPQPTNQQSLSSATGQIEFPWGGAISMTLSSAKPHNPLMLKLLQEKHPAVHRCTKAPMQLDRSANDYATLNAFLNASAKP